MMDSLILTIDVGTTSIKVSLFRPDEPEPLAAVSEEYRLETAADGIVELDPTVYREAAKNGIRRIASKGIDRVAAVGVTSQGETLIPVDARGNALCKAIVWLDSRAKKQAAFLREHISDTLYYSITGLPGLTGATPLAKLLWLRDEKPTIFQAADKFLLIEDYLLYWLTGRFVTEPSVQSSTGWFNLRDDIWWADALQLAGVGPDRLGELLPCGTIVGTLRADTARELGVPPTAVAVTGAMDQAAAAIGIGCIQEGDIIETTGTALVMAACTGNPDFGSPNRIILYRHALDGKFLYLPFERTAGMFLKWFRDEFCLDISDGQAGGYDALDHLAEQIPAGADGLVMLPYLAGSTCPELNPNACGVFFGVTLNTSRAHFLRGILESVGYQLREFLEVLCAAGLVPQHVRSLGGGSRSALWQQIKADVCGIPFTVSGCGEAPSAGVALLAAWGSGLLPQGQYPTAKKEQEFLPNPANAAVYAAGYQRFRALQQAARPVYDLIRK